MVTPSLIIIGFAAFVLVAFIDLSPIFIVIGAAVSGIILKYRGVE